MLWFRCCWLVFYACCLRFGCLFGVLWFWFVFVVFDFRCWFVCCRVLCDACLFGVGLLLLLFCCGYFVVRLLVALCLCFYCVLLSWWFCFLLIKGLLCAVCCLRVILFLLNLVLVWFDLRYFRLFTGWFERLVLVTWLLWMVW